MDFLRTPDERFHKLPGYDFAPRYIEIKGLRMHYLDEGSVTGAVVLLLHGEPSWSYLYRQMIPLIVKAGHRAIAPDLFGFGRSDKPVKQSDYSYQFHVEAISDLLRQLDLTEITLFGQDWGGLIGLRVAAENPQRFARIVAANTFLPTGDTPPSEAFLKWQAYSQAVEEFHAGGIVRGAVVKPLSEAVVAAYDAPFPDESYKAGARAFPLLVPISPDDPAAPANRRAWEVLRNWTKPFLTAFSDSDPITRGGDRAFQKLIPGTQNQAHTTINGAGHFLQEDKGEELATLVVEFIANTHDHK
ncbi:MAG: haloalkane dehalogenase [Acidobacteria bacterium]|nr:haloalkane dehalogenase [Acidobacteriota bacterium]